MRHGHIVPSIPTSLPEVTNCKEPRRRVGTGHFARKFHGGIGKPLNLRIRSGIIYKLSGLYDNWGGILGCHEVDYCILTLNGLFQIMTAVVP